MSQPSLCCRAPSGATPTPPARAQLESSATNGAIDSSDNEADSRCVRRYVQEIHFESRPECAGRSKSAKKRKASVDPSPTNVAGEDAAPRFRGVRRWPWGKYAARYATAS
ncbi:hypothetical protein Cni_G02135 [Canna indica]|uniref:AP2/ERF domain-containing protein n=1 Tax=Canna indica TaxID=4628 RepID=A0AAQ3JNW3_9LILI|nr:hypothetical protein Cni_G02135 [Canna indica]